MPSNTTPTISRSDLDSLLEYTERYAAMNDEPANGDCQAVVRRGHVWLETGSATIDLAALQADLIQYATRFAQLNREPDTGKCWKLLAKVRPSSTEAAVVTQASGSSAAAPASMNSDVRDALLFALWHHQGGWSPVGQPLRRILRMGVHERLNDTQLAGARRVQAGLASPATADAISSIDRAFDGLNSILDASGSLEAEATKRAVYELRLQIARAQDDGERIRVAEEMLAEMDAPAKQVRFVVDADRVSGGYVAFSVTERSLDKIGELAGLANARQGAAWKSCSDGSLNLSVEWGSDVTSAAAGTPICDGNGPCEIVALPGGDMHIKSALVKGMPRETVTRKGAVVDIFNELSTGFEEAEDGEIVFLTDNREVHELYARDHAGHGEVDSVAQSDRQRG